jgi:hypothetical protein
MAFSSSHDLKVPVQPSQRGSRVMVVRCILTITSLLVAMSASAAELKPDEAKRFIAGKVFSYRCFDGTTGRGRIDANGSVLGTIQADASAPPRVIALPVGTIRVQSDSICASVPQALIQPCFTVTQIDSRSFRGAIAGLPLAYCDFVSESPRPRPQRQPPVGGGSPPK